MTSAEHSRQLNAKAAAVELLAARAHQRIERADWTAALPLLRLADEASRQLQQDIADTMRLDGASWLDIGRALGVTKQSANARFNRARR